MRISDTQEYRTALGLLLALGNREVSRIVYPDVISEPLDDVKMSKDDKDDKHLENFYCGTIL